MRSNDDFRYEVIAAVAVCAAIVVFVFLYGTFTSSKAPDASQPFLVGRSDAHARSEGALDYGTHGASGSLRAQAGSAVDQPRAAQAARTGARQPTERGASSAGADAHRTPAPTGAVEGNRTPARGAEAAAGGKETPLRAATHASASAAHTPSSNDTNRSDEPTPGAGDERNDLSISGRVLNQGREPVPGINVVARKYTSQPGDAPDAGAGQSGADGRYEIRGLSEGEYEIRTIETERYRAAQVTAQAGFSSADIILEGDYEIRVVGTVTDTDGNPLGGVRVVPADLRRETRTDSSGNYQAYLVVRWTEGTYAFQFQLQGYKDKLVYVAGADVSNVQETRVDAQLEPAGETTTVNGSVSADDGTPVAGATIQMQSAELKTQYTGISRPDGRFSIANVRTGDDYRVSVLATAGYQDYVQAPVEISAGASLDIVLQSLNKGRLFGRMVDTEGNPIPHFSLWLTSADARAQALPVSSDDSGAFVVEQAPAGVLTFATRSVPALQVSGITLNGGDQQDVTVVLDWGDLVLAGHVTDDRDVPVKRVQVLLSWSDQIGGLRSGSMRSTLTGDAGEFQFTQLGPGPHRISISAPGSGAQQSREVPAGTRQFDVQVSSPAQ